jgi:hypothetical protein
MLRDPDAAVATPALCWRPQPAAATPRPTLTPRRPPPPALPSLHAQLLNLGFGMMIPGWFLGGTQNGTVWFAKHAPFSSEVPLGFYSNTLWTQSPVEGQGNFDYFSILNGTYAGLGHHFSAPSPLGLVINEYSNMTAHNFSSSDPVFDVPTSPTCVNASVSYDGLAPRDAALRALSYVAKYAPALHPEVVIAAHSHGLL